MNGRGLAYAMTSVALVSAAQLVMRWSMTRLPRIEALPVAPQGVQWLPMGLLMLGIAWYAASLLCWLRALESLPLGRAYSLLSLSYPLVYLFAALLPGLGGSLTVGKTLGVILVVAGVVLINARQAQPVGFSRSPM